MVRWVVALIVLATASGLVAYGGIAGSAAALAQSAFPVVLIALMASLLYAAWSRG
jgi:uncharacterized membrane protein YtjA (UPF0391 family)